MKIRLANLDDLPRLAIINGYGTDEGRKIAEKELPRFINAKNLILAETNDDIVSLLYWEEKFFGEGNWFLTQVTVDEGYRRQGIGEALWKYFLNYAKEHGAKAVFADIRETNTPSSNLAKKLGGADAGYLDLADGDPRKFYRFDF